MSIEQGIEYRNEVWKQLNDSFEEFASNLKEYRETIFARQECDMYYLGYFLRCYVDSDFEDVRFHMERGWRDSEMVKESDL